MINIGDHIGVFDVLADSFKHDSHGHKMWVCRCVCGNIREVSTRYLLQKRSSKVKRCFCHKGENGRGSFSQIWSRYIRHAKGLHVEFALSQDVFKQIITGKCHYCDSSLTNRHQQLNCKGPFYYTGIDRKDPKLGYSVDNSVPCCKKCNMMKHLLSYEEFIKQVRIIAEHCKETS